MRQLTIFLKGPDLGKSIYKPQIFNNMEKLVTVIVNLLTLGIPALIEACTKPADRFTYVKNKKGRCRHAKRCCYSCHCLETTEDCKRLHCNHNDGNE